MSIESICIDIKFRWSRDSESLGFLPPLQIFCLVFYPNEHSSHLLDLPKASSTLKRSPIEDLVQLHPHRFRQVGALGTNASIIASRIPIARVAPVAPGIPFYTIPKDSTRHTNMFYVQYLSSQSTAD